MLFFCLPLFVPSLLALNRSGESLGSGQFGVVYRGTWQCEMGQVGVAIKTVKGGVSETDRVKFLQEAAINGQFRHPNIVKLHGVVTVGEPVMKCLLYCVLRNEKRNTCFFMQLMIVLEYLPNGDLRTFLHSQRTG